MKVYIVAALVVLLSVSSYADKPLLLGGRLCLNQVNCFVNPCQVSRCEAHPRATCRPNYCGGCHAFWYVDNKQVDCSAPVVESEPTNCEIVHCFVDPCGFAKCKNHPEAECRANYCGGCNAWFYIGEKRVQCD